MSQDRTGAVPALVIPVIYPLTLYGESVLPMLDLVRLWGTAHVERTPAPHPDSARQAPSCSHARDRSSDGAVTR